jgi:hypothetical protein
MAGWEPPLLNPGDANKKYQWMTRGENCPMCQAMAGRVYYIHVYVDSTVYPGFHANCDCYLKEVDILTPQSDMDIFGSSFNTHYDGWLELLFNNPSNLWWAYNVELTRNIMKYSQPGMTAAQSIQAMQANQPKGIVNSFGYLGQVDMSWNVWRTASPDLYMTLDKWLTSMPGMFLKPIPIKPVLPTQSYHNPIYNLDFPSSPGW